MTLNKLPFQGETIQLKIGGLVLGAPHSPRGQFADSNSQKCHKRRRPKAEDLSCSLGAGLSSEKAKENLLPPEADGLERAARQFAFAFLLGQDWGEGVVLNESSPIIFSENLFQFVSLIPGVTTLHNIEARQSAL